MTTTTLAIEVGIYSKYEGIEPTVCLGSLDIDEHVSALTLYEFIKDIGHTAEVAHGAPALPEQRFVRIFER
jgi:hypothetical protein